MLCSFTIRFRNFIWFLIFTFTLYCMPNYELLLPYKIHFAIAEAGAAEATQESSARVAEASGADQTQTSENNPAPEEAPPSPPEPPTTTSSQDSGSSTSSSMVSFKIDDFTGAAHLSHPIAVPPGRSGLAPQLSVSYFSSGDNGWIGTGWDILTGYLQRRGPRKGVPRYDDTKDVYELNLGGIPQELVSIGNDEYRLRIEGAYLKIRYYSSGNYWEVWDKSGLKMRFGYSVSSRIGKVRDPNLKNDTYRWCLDRVDDQKTNYMELTYQKDLDENQKFLQIYPQRIQYNGQVSAGLPHNHEVLFNLEPADRPDFVYSSRGGFRTLTRKRLSSLEVRTAGNLVRKYQLEYKVSNVKSLLLSITVYGSDNTSTLPPTTFTYQTHTIGFEGQVESWYNPSALDPVDGNYIRNSYGNQQTYADVIDMDGDGFPDRVKSSPDCPHPYTDCPWSVYLNKENGFNNDPILPPGKARTRSVVIFEESIFEVKMVPGPSLIRSTWMGMGSRIG